MDRTGSPGRARRHLPYDDYDYLVTYINMKKCFDLMEEAGLRPRAYAYPQSSYSKESTRTAHRVGGG